jgi:hypothetical protein
MDKETEALGGEIIHMQVESLWLEPVDPDTKSMALSIAPFNKHWLSFPAIASIIYNEG